MFRWVSGAIERLENWHQQTVVARWPYRPARTRLLLLAIMALATLASFMNMQVRNAQYQAWETHYDGEAPFLFSTTDAPYFLRQASSIKDGESIVAHDSIRLFPSLSDDLTDAPTRSSLRSRPLLSVVLAFISGDDDTTSLLTNANHAILFTTTLTALMVVVCFGAAGYWLEGSVAAIGGGLSVAYLTRSSIGRIDTDQLNLGFMYLIFGLVVFAGKASSRFKCLLWCIAAGATANFFMWWYDKPALIFVAAIALGWLLLSLRRDPIITVAGSVLFLLIADVRHITSLDSTYFKKVISAGGLTFPSTFQTITEIQQVSLPQILINTTGSLEMGMVCILGLAFFLVRHPVISIAYGPLAVFGLLNFVIGNRAIFYSAPMMWFGGAFLIITMARFIADQIIINGQADESQQRGQIALVVAASFATIVAWVNSPTNYVPEPSFPKPVIEGLASLNTTVDPEQAVVATWWDYGYASMFFNKLPTLHDGGSQTTPTTHFVARALLHNDQAGSLGRLKFLSTKGNRGIEDEDGLAGLNRAFIAANGFRSPDLYLVVTNQMAGWMGSISQIGNWDIEKGEPIQLRGNPDGAQVHYKPINCRFNGYPRYLNCAGLKIDLERGLINGQPLLVGWTHTQDGETLRRRSFDHDTDHAIQIVQNGGRITAYLLHRQLYESTFNKLYYQGLVEHPSVSLHYDDYPHIRIYKVDGTPAAQANKS